MVVSSNPLLSALSASSSAEASSVLVGSKGAISSSSFPDSTFEISSRSLRMFSSDSPEEWIVLASSFCVLSVAFFSSSSAIPRTPIIGVRISWLMLAKKRDFAALASIASFLASPSFSTVDSNSLLLCCRSIVRSVTCDSSSSLCFCRANSRLFIWCNMSLKPVNSSSTSTMSLSISAPISAE